MNPVRSQRGASRARERKEFLSQKPKVEKVSSQMSKLVLKSIQSVFCGEDDMLITINTEESWVTRNPSICRCPSCLEDLGRRVRVQMRALGGLG